MALQNEKIKKGKRGVNYVTSVVDNNFCNFNPIFQENDVGIDGQIEIFDSNGLSKGEFIFVQIKTGNSYYDSIKKTCFIPIGSHEDYWEKIKFPVIGIVCLIDENGIDITNAYWVDIKKYLNCYRDNVGKETNIVFSANKYNEFNKDSFRKYFIPLIEKRLPDISFDEARELITLGGDNKELGIIIICKKHAQYKESWEMLFEEYYNNGNDMNLVFFYDSISYAFSHPDHFYQRGNYELSEESKKYVRSMILKFTVSDIIRMLEVIGETDIARGTIGQSIEILIDNIDGSNKKLYSIINMRELPSEVRNNAELILAYHDANYYKFNIKKALTPDEEYTKMLTDYINKYGCVDLY